jgi:hypothetical protein
MRKVLAIFGIWLGFALSLSGQVVGLTPTPLAWWDWNPNTLQWQQVPNSYAQYGSANTPQAIAFYGWNASLGQWTPCTTDGSCPFGGSSTGCSVNSPNDCVITDPTGSQTIVQPDGTSFVVSGTSGEVALSLSLSTDPTYGATMLAAMNLGNGGLDINANLGLDINATGGAGTGGIAANLGSDGMDINIENNGSYNLNVGGTGSIDMNGGDDGFDVSTGGGIYLSNNDMSEIDLSTLDSVGLKGDNGAYVSGASSFGGPPISSGSLTFVSGLTNLPSPYANGVAITVPIGMSSSYEVLLPITQGAGALTNDGSGNLSWSPTTAGVTSINSTAGAFTFGFSAGAGSCSGTTCTFTGSGSGGGSVENFVAASGSWPIWLVPSVATSTTTPTLSVSASAIPNAALANAATTVNGQTCTLGSTCTIPNSPGGASGQTQYNNAGAFGGYTMSGDATIVPSTGVITVTKSSGTAFGTAAFATLGNTGTDVPQLSSGLLNNSVINWAAPSAIGTGTPAAATFTALTATSVAGGSTYCVQINSSGVFSNTGTPCGSGGGPGTVNAGVAGQFSYYVTGGTAVSGNSHWTDVGGLLNASEAIQINDTGDPSQISLTPTTFAPTVVAAAATLAAPATIVTAGTYVLPNAPGAGALIGTNAAGVVSLSFEAINGAGAGLATGPSSSVDTDCVVFTGTAGALADSGAPCGVGRVSAGTTNYLAYYPAGTAAVSATSAVPNGITATTQSPGDNTTMVATDAFVIANGGAQLYFNGTLRSSPKEVAGISALTAGSVTITLPISFTSTSTFGCTTQDQTAFNSSGNTNLGANQIQLQGTGTHSIYYDCKGY